MEIYIEYVVFDNFIINLLILLFCSKITKTKYKKWGVVISDVFGTVCAVLLPLVSIKTNLLILLKLAVAIVMVGLLKKYANFKQYFFTLIVFFTVTFLMGGLCYGINELFGFKLSGGQLVVNNYSFPVSLFCVLASGYLYLFWWLVKYFNHRIKLNNYYFDVTVKLNGKVHFLRGFLDTGNKLKMGDSDVVLVPLKIFLKEFKEYPLEKICLNPTYLGVKSVDGLNDIIVIDLDEISIKNCERKRTMQNVKIGLSKATFGSDFEVLLNGNMI